MKDKQLTRHEIREKALQALFPLDFNAELTKQDAISHALALDYQELVDENGCHFIPEYLDQIVTGVCEHKAELDVMITKYLEKNWRLDRIAKMDLVILRIAIYEMLYEASIPNTVALNEALELTKKYSDDHSRKFVNGILANVVVTLDEKQK